MIVESPAKADTIKKILGRSYEVVASYGHLIDLPKTRLGVDIENNFSPKYVVIKGKGQILKQLKSKVKKVDGVYLATDPDREGEAIAWHLSRVLKLNNGKNRVMFNEITPSAVKKAMKSPQELDIRKVNAQQARRILDRLVGYMLSPLLWKKVKRALSAGRVQSVALKFICDREKEIQEFKPEEYWTLEVALSRNGQNILFLLDRKVKLASREDVDKLIGEMNTDEFVVSDVKEEEYSKSPPPPFKTSTLQQDASRMLGFSPSKTMMIAQRLYEGVDIGDGSRTGLITYMRTDSLRISDVAEKECAGFIKEKFGESYIGSGATFKKSKFAQDAHEAIRPTYVNLTPDKVRDALKGDEYKLYDLIWRRFVASQMSVAKLLKTTISVTCSGYIFKKTYNRVVFDGFFKMWPSSVTEEDVPGLKVGDKLLFVDWLPKQHFTQPPPRYTEASLIQLLEEKGIGRPSTYATIVKTVEDRGYVIKEKGRLVPTTLGKTVNDILVKHFSSIVNADFTADMEDKLDKIEIGEEDWVDIVREFYLPFSKLLEDAKDKIKKVELPDESEPTGELCPLCGRPLVVKRGRYGKFIACSGYPECKYTAPYQKKIGADCPLCGAPIVERVSKKGRRYYKCSNLECTFISWDRPVAERCPKCDSILLVKERRNKLVYYCWNDECDYRREEKNGR